MPSFTTAPGKFSSPRKRGPTRPLRRTESRPKRTALDNWVPAFAGTTTGIWCLRRFGRVEPRHVAPALGFVGVDLVFLAQREPDVVEAVQQAVFPEGIDVELDHAAVGARDFLPLEIDRDCGVGALLGIMHQLVDVGLRQR